MLNPVHEAKKLLQRFEIAGPVTPVKHLAELLGAKIIEKPLEAGLCGMIYKDTSGFIIGVNSEHPPARQRFTIAHEIAHLIMHSHVLDGNVHIDRAFGVQLNRDKRSALGEDLLEIQANKFAAELLMPTDLIKKEIKNAYIDIEDDKEVKRLADKYEVSVQAMSIKLFDTFKSDLDLFD